MPRPFRRYQLGAGALLLLVAFFLPAVDLSWWGTYSPLEGAAELADQSRSGWRRANVCECVGHGGWVCLVVCPHLFAALVLIHAALDRPRIVAAVSPLLLVWCASFLVVSACLLATAQDERATYLYFLVAAVAIVLGFPWLRRSTWTEEELMRRALAIGSVASLIWFSSWLVDATYGLYVAILGSATVLIGARQATPVS
ncbi:MAG: hypothetical protein ACYTHK_14235 [Planctomycetota bacterium]